VDFLYIIKAAPIYLLGLRISEAQNILSGRNKNKNKPRVWYNFLSGQKKIKLYFVYGKRARNKNKK